MERRPERSACFFFFFGNAPSWLTLFDAFQDGLTGLWYIVCHPPAKDSFFLQHLLDEQ